MRKFKRADHAHQVRRLVGCPVPGAGRQRGLQEGPEVAKKEYFDSGNKYFDQGKYKEAIVEYRNAIQQDPKFGEARLEAGRGVREGERRAATPTASTSARRTCCRTASRRRSRPARSCCWPGSFEDAKTRADKALEIDPKNVRGPGPAGQRDGGPEGPRRRRAGDRAGHPARPEAGRDLLEPRRAAARTRQPGRGRGGVPEGRRDRSQGRAGAPGARQLTSGRPGGRPRRKRS